MREFALLLFLLSAFPQYAMAQGAGNTPEGIAHRKCLIDRAKEYASVTGRPDKLAQLAAEECSSTRKQLIQKLLPGRPVSKQVQELRKLDVESLTEMIWRYNQLFLTFKETGVPWPYPKP
jgi:hypothetical protein